MAYGKGHQLCKTLENQNHLSVNVMSEFFISKKTKLTEVTSGCTKLKICQSFYDFDLLKSKSFVCMHPVVNTVKTPQPGTRKQETKHLKIHMLPLTVTGGLRMVKFDAITLF